MPFDCFALLSVCQIVPSCINYDIYKTLRMPERYNRQVIHIQSGKTQAQTVLGSQETISSIIDTSIALLHTLVTPP